MSISIGEYIKKLRKAKDYSINQLALYTDVSASHISRIERGLRIPSPDILEKLAIVLKIPYEDLLFIAGYIKNSKCKDDFTKLDKLSKTPVLREINPNIPMFLESNIIEHISLPEEYIKDGNYFCLKVCDNSMNLLHIPYGQIVLVRQQSNVDDGQIAVVSVDYKNAVIRKIYRSGDTVNLIPYSNLAFEPTVIDIKSTNIEVFGKVVRSIIEY